MPSLYEDIRKSEASRDVDWLLALGKELTKPLGNHTASDREWLFRTVIDSLVRIPGDDSVNAIFALAPFFLAEECNWFSWEITNQSNLVSQRQEDPFAFRTDRLRETASMLADVHKPEELVGVALKHVNSDRHLEFIACLVQELVLRGEDLSERQLALELAKRLKAANHPLAILPFKLIKPVELAMSDDLVTNQGHRLTRSTFGLNENSRDARDAMHSRADADNGPLPSWKETTDDATQQSLMVAFSNRAPTRWEARSFEFSERVRPVDLLADRLVSLDLQCVKRRVLDENYNKVTYATPYEHVNMRTSSPREIHALLLQAAIHGGIVGAGEFGAYSRLYAWLSLFALSGIPDDHSIAECAERTQDCAWFRFEAYSKFFPRRDENIGIATLNNNKLRVLAISDSTTL